MEKNHFFNSRWFSLLLVLSGNLIYALTVKLFVLPANLISCGTTGLSLMVNELTGLPISVFTLIFNVAMLALGWWILGKSFAMTTVLSSLLYPVLLEITNQILGDTVVTENMMLNVLFAGMGLGLSLGMVVRAGASTGGMDIPPLILQKLFRIPMFISLATFDFLIMLSQMFFHTMEDLMYGVLLILVISMVLNKVTLFGTSKNEVKIVSDQADKICQSILSDVDRGVTLLSGRGGYLKKPTEVILSVVSNHELVKIERLAREIDPACFIIVSQVAEVWGRGFSYGKRHPTPEK